MQRSKRVFWQQAQLLQQSDSTPPTAGTMLTPIGWNTPMADRMFDNIGDNTLSADTMLVQIEWSTLSTEMILCPFDYEKYEISTYSIKMRQGL